VRETPSTRYHYADAAGVELVITRHVGPGVRAYPRHAHVCHWTLGAVCSGKLSVESGAGPRVLGRGGVFVLPPKMAHTLELAENTILAVLCVNMRAGWRTAAGSLADQARAMAANQPWDGQAVAAGLEHLLQRAALLDAQPIPAFAQGAEAGNQAMQPVAAVAEMLRQQPEFPVSLDAMAHMAGLSQWHFLRLFQRVTGLTPHAYQMDCRLRRLRALLRTDATAAEAALIAGFADQSHMQRIFKRHHAITPQQFRRASIRL